MIPHKGVSLQCHNQQVLAKPHYNPSDRDQQARENYNKKQKSKAKHIFNLEKRHYKLYIEHFNQTYQLFYIYWL